MSSVSSTYIERSRDGRSEDGGLSVEKRSKCVGVWKRNGGKAWYRIEAGG